MEQPGKSLRARLVIIFGALAAVVLIGILVEAPDPSEDSPSIPMPGQIWKVANVPSLMPLTEKDDDELVQLANADDDLGIRRMIAEGRVLSIAADTTVRILEGHVYTCEVRVLDGEYEGQRGWIQKKDLRYVPSGHTTPSQESSATANQTVNKPSSGRAGNACVESPGEGCPAPGTQVLIQYPGEPRSREGLQAYPTEDAFQESVNSNPADDAIETFKRGEAVLIFPGSRAKVISSVGFTTTDTQTHFNIICVRIIEGSCSVEIPGDPRVEMYSWVDTDCAGRVLWVNGLFVLDSDGQPLGMSAQLRDALTEIRRETEGQHLEDPARERAPLQESERGTPQAAPQAATTQSPAAQPEAAPAGDEGAQPDQQRATRNNRPKPDDQTIVDEIEAKLFADSVLKRLDIRITCKDGVVTLRGSVRTSLQKWAVKRIAATEPGVLSVTDSLSVSNE